MGIFVPKRFKNMLMHQKGQCAGCGEMFDHEELLPVGENKHTGRMDYECSPCIEKEAALQEAHARTEAVVDKRLAKRR